MRLRTAFTLIELLVVLAIIAIVTAILLPAVQHAREASRKIHCCNNLKQLAVAVSSYHDAHGLLPPGGMYNGTLLIPSTWNSVSWLTQILPQMEQTTLFNALNFSLPVTALENQQVVHAPLESYRCPSDGGQSVRTTFTGVIDWPPNLPAAVTNYLGNLGDNTTRSTYGGWATGLPPPDDGVLGDGGTGRGLLWRNASAVRFADILDGTSQTFLAGECIPEQCEWNIWVWGNGATASTALPLNLDTHANPGMWEECYGFKSWHPRGANFAFADGSVRFVSQDISSEVYRALSTRSGLEVIDRISY